MNNVLFIAWRSGDSSSGCWGPVGRLEHGPGGYRFGYTRGARSLRGFQAFPGMPDLGAIYESEDLLPVFSNRLLDPSRPEYQAFLTWGGFDPNNPPDPIALLGVTGGLKQTDALEVFPCPQPDREGCYLTKFFLHGVRWTPPAAQERIAMLDAGEALGLMLDISNEHDRNAVAVRTRDATNRFIIGYVPRYLAQEVWELFLKCNPHFLELHVDRINKDAPLQQRVLCRLNACWPPGFRPCCREEFQPIASALSPLSVVG